MNGEFLVTHLRATDQHALTAFQSPTSAFCFRENRMRLQPVREIILCTQRAVCTLAYVRRQRERVQPGMLRNDRRRRKHDGGIQPPVL